MEPEEIIQDVKELLKFSNIGKTLFHKVKELKAILIHNLDGYWPLLENLASGKETHVPQAVRFELRRLAGHLWSPTIPEDTDYSVHEVMPQPLIDYIVNYQSEIGVIEMKPGLKLSGIPGKVFELTFEKTSPNHIWGIISMHLVNHSDFIYPGCQVDQSVFTDGAENTGKSEVLKLLLYYLLNHEGYYKHVTAEFFYRWKPLIDNEIIAETIPL